VCLCVDRNMLVPAFFVAAGAVRRAGSTYDVHILAEATEIDDAHRRWMEAHNIRAIPGLDFPRLREIAINEKRLTPATLIRLLMPGILATRYDRVLYLDADTEVCGDVAPLFDLDLGEAPLAAVPAARIKEVVPPKQRQADHAHFRALGMSEPFRYFNSGVMLIDIARWMAEDLGERLLRFIERNAAICNLPDEDALNAVLDGRIAEISPIWNLRSWEMAMPRVTDYLHPVIRHYDGPQKPWKRFSRNRRLFGLEAPYRRYRRFVAGTPWPGWLEKQWSGRDFADNIRFELRILTDRLRGKPTRGLQSAAALRRNLGLYRRYLQESAFADVEQGIAVRQGGRLRLSAAAG
jgi:lipopolysaccharide biosynthesis glycosyltransferase